MELGAHILGFGSTHEYYDILQYEDLPGKVEQIASFEGLGHKSLRGAPGVDFQQLRPTSFERYEFSEWKL